MHKICLLLLFTLSFAAQSQDTVLKFYRPFNKISEQSQINIIQQKSGHCFEQSKKIIREDAWRCQADGTIYDPCFSSQSGKQKHVICPNAPWNGQSLQINLTKALDNSQHQSLDMSRAYPWAIELENGIYCQAIESHEIYDNLPIHYRCSDQSLLIGHLQRCDPKWKTLNLKNNQVSTVNLKKVWF